MAPQSTLFSPQLRDTIQGLNPVAIGPHVRHIRDRWSRGPYYRRGLS